MSKNTKIIDFPWAATGDSPIHRACCLALEDLLPELLDKLGDALLDNLWRAESEAEDDAIKEAYREALAVFTQETPVYERFRARVLLQAEHLGVPPPSENEDRGTDLLSSVGEETLEGFLNESLDDWLNFVGETHPLEVMFEAKLRVLERRLSRVAAVAVDAQTNPYGPPALARAFRKALEEVPLHNAAKRVAYRTLNQVLEDILGVLYDRMVVLTSPLALESDPSPILDGIRQHELLLAMSRVGEAPVAQELPAGPELPPAALPSESGGPPTLASMFAMLMHRAQHASRSYASLGMAVPQVMPDQTDWAKVAAASLGFSGPLPESQLNALQLLGAVLHQVQSDPVTPDGLKPLIKRWQSPLLKLACQGPQLLNDSKHPARRLLDALDRISLATDTGGHIPKQLLQQLTQWSESLGRDDILDPEKMADAVTGLEDITAPLLRERERRIRHLREACEAQQRLKDACRAVNREIESRLTEATVPRLIVDLLQLGWRYWLVRTHLQSGEAGEDWRDGWAVLDSLWAWLAEGAAPPGSAEARRLIEVIEERLRPCSTDVIGYQRFVSSLAATLLEASPVERVASPAKSPSAVPDSPIRQRALERVRSFQVGDWFQGVLSPDAPPVPLCLVWIADDRDRFVFADRQGAQRLAVNAENFARELVRTRLVRGENLDLPLSERTIGGLMQTLLDNLRRNSTYDPVTGFLNRKGLAQVMEQEVFTPGAGQAESHVFCSLEIDQFRDISNDCGADGGDKLLRVVAGAIQRAVGPAGTLVRLGDARFGILLKGHGVEQGRGRAEKVLEMVQGSRFQWEGRSFAVGAFLGLVAFQAEAHTPELVLKRADIACLTAKDQGVHRVQIYTPDNPLFSAQAQMTDWAGRIDSILADRLLFSRCQLIAPLDGEGKDAPHYEILLGIRDSENRVISPGDFVAATERWNRVVDIDQFQVESVFEWIRQNPEKFAVIGGFSINLSGQSLSNEAFLDFLQSQLAMADWPLEKITFEITETAAIAEFARAERFLRKVRRYGCRFSLDDFGSGFASFGYLKNLPVDHLKIDGMFIRDLAENEADYTMVRSMNDLGHALGLKTIAEFVESEAIFERLREIGVDYVQGYLLGKPRPLDSL